MNGAIGRLWIKVMDEKGASMVEYALLLVLIALVVIVGAMLLGGILGDEFSDFGSTVQNAGT